MKFIIVTGMSGSGKTIALHALEDEGFYCIDNMPVFLVRHFTESLIRENTPGYKLSAIGLDVRADHDGFNEIPEIVKTLKQAGVETEIVSLETEDDILIKRFSETRRKHPLTDQNTKLTAAIRREREILKPLTDNSTIRIDTSNTTLHQLRKQIRDRVARVDGDNMTLQIESFGFKYGAPKDADFVFDVRCLPNPHWQSNLRPLTGKDQPVIEFLEAQQQADDLYHDIRHFVEKWIPAFKADGRSYLTVAVGCTGGQHRSVYMVEKLRAYFEKLDIVMIHSHRELGQ